MPMGYRLRLVAQSVGFESGALLFSHHALSISYFCPFPCSDS
jgi:hypothetical protein